MKAVAVLCLAFLAGWPLVAPAQNPHTLPLVRPVDFAGQESLVRIVNRSDTSGTVRITAIDDTGERFGPVILTLDARQAVNITSRNLERGNTAVGLPVGIGDGSGSWRLELETALTIEALAYIRTPDGFLTSMHDVASMSEGGDHWVPIFNPGSNTQKVSHLRLINPGSTAAEVTVTGRDDLGDEASGTVSLRLPAGAARTLSAQALETGVGLDGSLGDGAGKWRLNVRSTTDIQVMSLLATPTGHLANLSTAPSFVDGSTPPPDDHGDTCDTATVVGANSTTAGRLETRGDVNAFRFELPSAGSLQVQTTGSTDTVGRLYRGTTLRGSDDDGGTGTNFRITEAEAQAGTWCVEVRGYGTTPATGPYTLQVEFSNNGPGPMDVGVPSTTPGRLETSGDIDVFRFELPSADRLLLRVQTTGSTDTVGRLLYRGTTLRGSDDDGGTGTNFRITEAEAQAGTWYVEVSGYRNATGPYTLHVETQSGVCGWDYAGWAAGHALNRGSEAAARRDAINWCTQHARPFEYSRDCTVRASFRNCGAVAFGARNDGSDCVFSSGTGSSRGAAERNALTACQNFQGGAYRPCRIAVTDRPTSTRLSFCNSSGHGAIATTWAFRSAPAIGGSGGKSAEKQEVSGEEDSSVSTSRAPQ